jgi:redox-sensitive bicupin YhaK (pirin superfamily)
MYETVLDPNFVRAASVAHYPATDFPWMHPIHWLRSHFAVGGWSPLQRLSGMLTAHMTSIAPHNGFTWHPHRGLEIYTWVLEGTLHHEDSTGGEGDIGPGELQRMFSGQWIEHQELNHGDDPVRVIQIWYVADFKHFGLAPHYQQVPRTQLPARRANGSVTYDLIGADSPMEQHMRGRLTSTTVEPGGQAQLEAPRADEDLFLYVTDGAGEAALPDGPKPVGQYDVLLARPDTPEVKLSGSADQPLHYLSFYLPKFLS